MLKGLCFFCHGNLYYNYVEAIAILKKRYGQESKVIAALFSAFYNLPIPFYLAIDTATSGGRGKENNPTSSATFILLALFIQRSTTARRCQFCDGDHSAFNCSSHPTATERKEIAGKKKLCFNCLKLCFLITSPPSVLPLTDALLATGLTTRLCTLIRRLMEILIRQHQRFNSASNLNLLFCFLC